MAEKRPIRRADDPTASTSRCPFDGGAVDATGYCATAQAWLYPRFRCPHCAGPLTTSGFCETCTPKRREFVGDYFEPRFEADAGREYGHYVRVHRGPTPVVPPARIDEFLAELRAVVSTTATVRREPGDEADLVPF